MHVVEDAIRVERLAFIALRLMDAPQRTGAWLEKSFQEALPKALRLVELTEEFLKQKEDEKNAYWRTAEGKKELERFSCEPGATPKELNAYKPAPTAPLHYQPGATPQDY
jgi:hypothetical protein